MVGPKLCLMCKQKIIAPWESACSACWQKLVEHDLCPMCHGNETVAEPNNNGGFVNVVLCHVCKGSGYTGNQREWMITLNHTRELLRSCGIDLTELDAFW